uniref:Uncharacterized protein n=1 Tax=Aegilops tauschii subsp. strangulata TaxID=200361 RepID=A0A453PKI6_AEGTS
VGRPLLLCSRDSTVRCQACDPLHFLKKSRTKHLPTTTAAARA